MFHGLLERGAFFGTEKLTEKAALPVQHQLGFDLYRLVRVS
jgi:hypothetical protein